MLQSSAQISKRQAIVDASLHPKQGLAFLSQSNELAYGGAAGGGKSHLGRIMAIHFCAAIPGLQVYLFRREYNELRKNHMEGVTSLPMLLKPWVDAGKVQIVKNEVRFWHGSKIFLCSCQHEKDIFKWLGPEMYFLIVEQAEQFTEFMLRMLFGRNRMPAALNIPEKYKHLFPRVLYTFNPGNVGHAFFKKNFSDEWKKRKTADDPYPIWQMPKDKGGRRRQFIQALLQDNPSVNPEEYAATLSFLPPRMIKALLEGDMDQVIGSYFPDLQRDVHLIKNIALPDYLTRMMSMDWGSAGEADPFSIGWWAVSDGNVSANLAVSGEVIKIPRNAIICYRTYRGHGRPKTTVKEVAKGIKFRELKDPPIVQRVVGGDIKKDMGLGVTIFEEFSKYGIHFARADMRRVHGWQQLQERVIGGDEGPMIYWMEECEDSFEAVRALQHDTLGDPNDIAQGDDHDGEMTRYQVMARPWAKSAPPKEQPLAEKYKTPTIEQLWKQREAMLRRKK